MLLILERKAAIDQIWANFEVLIENRVLIQQKEFMRTSLQLTIKVNLSVFLISVLAFLLLCADLTISHDFAYFYSKTVFSEVCVIENTFAAPATNVVKIDPFDILVFIITILSVGIVLRYMPNLATLSRAPPHNLFKLDFI